MAERTKYSSSLLIEKEPYESTEAIRIRLSEAKLINKDFFLVLKEVSELQANYNQKLRKIISQNENLSAMLSKQLLSSQILTDEEAAKYTFNSIGEVQKLWDVLINGLKSDLEAHTHLQLVLQHDVTSVLKNNTETDSKWVESRKVHSRLSQAAAAIDYYKSNPDKNDTANEAMSQWARESPYLFELFENVDYDRLDILKECLLKYQTGYSDYLLTSTRNCETGMADLLAFDPENEIDRFSKDALNFNFKLSTPRSLGNDKNSASQNASPNKKEKRRSTFGNIGHRLTSNSTVLHHDLMNNEFSDSNNNSSIKNKKSGSLKSRVGSIFGRNKLKNKKSQNFGTSLNDTIPEQSSMSSRTPSRTSTRNNMRKQAELEPPLPREQLQEIQNSNPQLSNSMDQTMNTQTPTYMESQQPTPQQSPQQFQQQFQQQSPLLSQPKASPQLQSFPQEQFGQASMNKPLPEEPVLQQSPALSSKPLHIQAPSVPPSRKQNRSSVFEENDVNINVNPQLEGASQSANITNRFSMLQSQVTPGLQALDPQATGASTTLSGQSIFQHEGTGETKFGLNASVAEVINAKFKDGILESSQLVGELALVYSKDPSQDLPIGLNMKIENGEKFEKVILNQAFIERVSPDEYKVNPMFINARTLGAIKYSIPEPEVPVIVQPVWKFEQHQASAILTIKMSPTVPLSIQSITLNDFAVHVSIDGAEVTNALSKPQGSFNKERKRISWKFKQPLVLTRHSEERLIARFMTEGVAHQTDKSVLTKFTILKSGDFGGSLNLLSQESNEENPFGGAWEAINTTKTLTAGNYIGLST